MKCPYCHKNVVGHARVVMIVGEGPAHFSCHEQHVLSARQFQDIPLSSMNQDELIELKEMVLIELNARSRHDAKNNEIEMFC